MSTLDDKDYAAALLKEYERLATEIRTIENTNEKIIGLGVGVITAGFAYGIAQKIDGILFFIPLAFAGIFLFAILQYHNLFWYGGYKKVIEERINELFERSVIGWEVVVSKRPRVHVINGALVAVYVLVSTGATIYCLLRVFAEARSWIFALYACVTVALFVLILLGVRRMGRAFHDAEIAAREWAGLLPSEARTRQE